MALTVADLAVVDTRIRASQRMDITKGTAVSDSDSLSNVVYVIMDGSGGVAAPVKKFGQFHVYAEDRVGLIRIGTQWTVVGTFNNKVLGGFRADDTLSAGSTVSTSYAALPGAGVNQITKAYDDTTLTNE